MSTSKPPTGLAAEGKALWERVTKPYTLEPDEERMLEAACRTLDELRTLERKLKRAPATIKGSKGQERVHPLYGEVRAHRLALRQLLAAVGIPESSSDSGAARSDAGRQLARKRWERRGAA